MHRRSLLPLCLMFVTLGACARQDAAPAAAATPAPAPAPASPPAVSPMPPNAALSPELQAHFGSTDGTGVLVSRVEPGMPADKGGIAVGDVITHVRGKVVDDPADVLTAIADSGKASRVDVRVLREKKRLTLDIALDADAPSSNLRSMIDFDWVKRFLDGARDGATRPAT